MTAVYPSFVMVEREGLKLRVAPGATVAPGTMPRSRCGRRRSASRLRSRRRAENNAAGVVTEIGYLGTMSHYKVRLDSGLCSRPP